jgi:hypothetical protein
LSTTPFVVNGKATHPNIEQTGSLFR